MRRSMARSEEMGERSMRDVDDRLGSSGALVEGEWPCERERPFGERALAGLKR